MIERKKYNGITAKSQIEAFFEKCRTLYGIYAFENEDKKRYDFLKSTKIPMIVTFQSKKTFFVANSDNLLVETGFVMQYENFTKELLAEVKSKLIEQFKNSFYIKFKKEDDRNNFKEVFGGQIIIKNIKF